MIHRPQINVEKQIKILPHPLRDRGKGEKKTGPCPQKSMIRGGQHPVAVPGLVVGAQK